MRHSLRFLLLLVCAAYPLAAFATLPASMFRGGPQLTGVYGADSAAWIDGVRFTFRTDGPIRGTPTVYQGVLYVGSGDGSLYAIDARMGTQRWRRRTNGAITSTPAAGGGAVYFSSRDGNLYCVGAKDGALRWKHHFGPDLGPQNYWDYYVSSPTLVAGSVIIGSGDGHVYAIDAASGHVRWRFDAGSRVRSTVAVQAGIVVFGTMSGHVHALRERDGSPLWKFATAGAARTFADDGNDTTAIFGSPTIAGAMVTVGGRDGFLYALDLASGRQVWRTTHDGSSWILSTAADGRTLYVGSGSASFVQAADLATGAEKWRFKTRGAVFSSLTLAGATLLFTDFSGTLYAVDKASGERQWQFPLGGRSLSTPIVADGIVYCSSDRGIVVALTVSKTPHAAAAAPRRVVYWEGRKTADAFSWFQNGVDAALLAQLKAAGYEQLDSTQLAQFMREQGAQSPPGVVVFADNKIPESLTDEAPGAPLIRRYLDAGGKIALLGPNPLAYRSDPVTGVVSEIDFSIPQRIFDVRYPELNIVSGYYPSAPTAAGRTEGLRTFAVGYMAIDPHQDVTVLALDEYGKASSWLRRYGGPEGTGLLQLTFPRQELANLSEFQAVIEYGVTW